MHTSDLWSYPGHAVAGRDLSGYSVEALDGEIGTVDEATYEVGSSYLVVDTGPWIFGKKVMLPAGMVDHVDDADERVVVSRTKDEIRNSPEFDEYRYRGELYRRELSGYYGPGGAGYRIYDETAA